MRLNTLGRLLGALCLAGSLSYVAAGSATASTPGWVPSVTPLPSMVHNGADAGYEVTITNNGTSNIAQLFLVSADTATFVGGPDGGDCLPAGVALKCSFGSLSSGASVTIVAAFATPSSGKQFSELFEANTTGVTLSDKHHTSHGDTLDFSGVTDLTSDKDFGGGFDPDMSLISSDGSIGKNNVQSTQVTPPVRGVIATVQDGLASDTFDCQPDCNLTPFGDWSRVTVGSGGTFDDGNGGHILFPVSLLVYGKSLPSGVTASSIQLIHVLDDGTVDILSQTCGATPTLNCLTVTKVGPNYKITGWVAQNGGFKGMG